MNKIYLDTNIVSGIVKDDLGDESAPLTTLLELFDIGTVELLTSRLAEDEVGRYQGQMSTPIRRVCHLLEKVAFVEEQTLLGFSSQWDHTGGFCNPLIEDDRIWLHLRQMGLDRVDAHHVMLAIRAQCDIFLTCDRRSILRYRNGVQAVFSIRLMRPSEVAPLFKN